MLKAEKNPHLSTENTLAIFPMARILLRMTSFLSFVWAGKKRGGGGDENEILKFLLDGNWKKTMIKSHSFGLF